MYDEKAKIETARKLKNLRIENGKRLSHRKLSELIAKENQGYVISDKTLLNYEIVDPEHNKFNSGFGMSVRNLVALADFYGVSCDDLLGREKNDEQKTKMLALEMGLANETVDILKCVNKYINKGDLLLTINSIIQSIDTSELLEAYEINKNDYLEPPIINNENFPKGFIDLISLYLFFECSPQYIEMINDDKYDREFEEHNQLKLDENEVANIKLVEIEKYLIKSRKNFRSIRKDKIKAIKKMFSIKGKEE